MATAAFLIALVLSLVALRLIVALCRNLVHIAQALHDIRDVQREALRERQRQPKARP